MNEQRRSEYRCIECGRLMGVEAILGAVCGRCVRRNHARAIGMRGSERKQNNRREDERWQRK